MKVYIAGNPLVAGDSLPFRILPELRRHFPGVILEEADPNENFMPEEGSVIIDTVEGIDAVTVFKSPDAFVTTKSVSAHDYDLGFHLLLLKKMNKLSAVTILGIPQKCEAASVVKALRVLLDDKRQ